MSEQNHILSEIKGHAGIITINRPDVYNALNNANKWAIIFAIREFENNDQVSSIIITGNGKAFSTGQDLNDRAASEESSENSEDSKHTSKTKKNLGDTLEKEWNKGPNNFPFKDMFLQTCFRSTSQNWPEVQNAES